MTELGTGLREKLDALGVDGAGVRHRAFAIARLAGDRLRARWPMLVAVAAILAVLVATKALHAWAALAGLFAVAVLFAIIREPNMQAQLPDATGSASRGDAVPLDETAGPPLPEPRRDRSWRAVVDAMSDPALALDTAGYVVFQNVLVTDLFPRARVGQPISQVSRSPELLEAVDRAMSSAGRIVVHLQDRVPIERRVSAFISRLPLDEVGPEAPALLVTFRDVTDKEKLAQMRADFITNASHELRTPLASLRGFVETLQGPAREDSAARDRFLAIMAAQATRMTRLIDDLLSLSRIEMQLHLPPRGVADLGDIVGFVAQTLEPLAAASGITIQVQRLDGPARVVGDRDELVQVFQNLIQNAIKYNREGGRVTVSLSRLPAGNGRAQRIAVAVTDTGPGIAAEHLPRLTERFYRVSVTQSREKGGTGLGLAIVKNIVNRHRGELLIESRLGHGSTFTVIIDEMI
jgi:two-component system phosphate regulon sensor histidine kinase PhoR